MDPHDQQWLTARSVSEAGLLVDDIWVRYVSSGGVADSVAVAAYLHGLVILDVLQRDLVSFAVNGLLADSAGEGSRATAGNRIAPEAPISTAAHAGGFSGDDGGVGLENHRQPCDPPAWRDAVWPRMQTRLVSMFDPDEAENRRLRALLATGVVQAGQEERFDRLARRAQQEFGAFAAMISFVEADDHVIKAVATTGEHATAWEPGRRTSRENSLCHHTIAEDRTLMIPDIASEDVTSQYPLMRVGTPIRFYAGHPLTGPGGWRIGALCVMDTTPRVLSNKELRRLRVLAACIQIEILDVDHS